MIIIHTLTDYLDTGDPNGQIDPRISSPCLVERSGNPRLRFDRVIETHKKRLSVIGRIDEERMICDGAIISHLGCRQEARGATILRQRQTACDLAARLTAADGGNSDVGSCIHRERRQCIMKACGNGPELHSQNTDA